jgi:ferritin-like metal-binding protein YciE
MSISNLRELFTYNLQDTHYAETRIFETLPEMIEAAEHPELKQALSAHRQETRRQIERLNEVFEMLGRSPGDEECEAINGILEEGEELLEETEGTPMGDLGLIASGLAVEHYEIVRYRCLVNWASMLGLVDVAALLQESLLEEEATDRTLSTLAGELPVEDPEVKAAI